MHSSSYDFLTSILGFDHNLSVRPAPRPRRRRSARASKRLEEARARVIRPLPFKIFYTTGELTRAIGISRYLVFKLIKMLDMFVYPLPGATLVPFNEIRDKLPPVWDVICLTELRRREEADRSKKAAPAIVPDVGNG